jgi:AraC family transcriptional regulator
MNNLIPPEQLVQWIPGNLTLDSTAHAWDGITLKGYSYTDLEVNIPTMRDFMIVVYKGGVSDMSRRSGGVWTSARVEPGVVSILTRDEQSQWRWDKPIDVAHMYLSHSAMAKVAGEVLERDIEDIEMYDLVRSEDKVLPYLQTMFENELSSDGFGGNLYVESLRNQLCIHVLRRFANVIFREQRAYGRLSPTQCRQITQYVDENIEQNITLDDLSSLTQIPVFSLIRKFQTEFNCPPHAYVMGQRLEHAKRMLVRSNVPLKVVAANCGFSDQSHMTRYFRRFLNLTPSEYRRSAAG